MNIKISHEKGRVPILVLSIDGAVDSSNYEQLEQAALKEIDQGAQYLLMDLTEVRFMSSAGFRSMTKIFKRLRSLSMDGSDDEMHKGINAGYLQIPLPETLQTLQGSCGNHEN